MYSPLTPKQRSMVDKSGSSPTKSPFFPSHSPHHRDTSINEKAMRWTWGITTKDEAYKKADFLDALLKV